MKAEDAVKLLNENRANSVYQVYIPSLGKEFPFRFVTVGDQMSLSKMAMEDKQSVFYQGLMALIWNSYAGESFDKDIGLKNLNELDKMVILTEIKNHCSTRNLQYTLTCPECGNEFKHTLKMDAFVKKLKKIGMQSVSYEKTVFGTKYGFELNWPNINTNLNLYKWTEGNEEENEQILYGTYGMIFSYVRRMWLNDEEVEDLNEKKVDERMKLFYELPDEVVNTSNPESVSNKINEKFNQPYSQLYRLNCPSENCDYVFDNFIDTENFFLNS